LARLLIPATKASSCGAFQPAFRLPGADLWVFQGWWLELGFQFVLQCWGWLSYVVLHVFHLISLGLPDCESLNKKGVMYLHTPTDNQLFSALLSNCAFFLLRSFASSVHKRRIDLQVFSGGVGANSCTSFRKTNNNMYRPKT